MKRIALVTALILAAAPVWAQSANDEGPSSDFDAARSAVQATALALDTNKDDLISREEFMSAAVQAFPIYDADNSGDIDEIEFRSVSIGFSEMAAARGRQQAYDAAFGLVFDLFDRVGDRLLDEEEFLTSINGAFSYADLDGDDSLTTQEFLGGFIMNVALRHALRG